jgi:hypothetical protein
VFVAALVGSGGTEASGGGPLVGLSSSSCFTLIVTVLVFHVPSRRWTLSS